MVAPSLGLSKILEWERKGLEEVRQVGARRGKIKLPLVVSNTILLLSTD